MTDPIRTYRPGGWIGVLGEHATVLLPPPEKRRAAELWQLVDDGAGFEEVLDHVLAGGLRTLGDLVLIGGTSKNTRVLVRGDLTVRVRVEGDTLEVAGAARSTWVERTLPGGAAVEAELEDSEPGAPELTAVGGLVRLSRLRHGAAGQADPRAVADDEGVTLAGRPVPSRFPTPAGIPGQPRPPAVISHAVARLVLSTGETIDVDRAVVIGRDPDRGAGPEQPRLVRVRSPRQEISSTHLEVRPGCGADHGCAVVTDLGSTNGTVLVQPGLPPEDLRAGIAVQLVPGSVIDLGDELTIRVLAP